MTRSAAPRPEPLLGLVGRRVRQGLHSAARLLVKQRSWNLSTIARLGRIQPILEDIS